MKNTTTRMCFISMMASMILVATFIRVPVPISNSRAMIHLGNAFCLFAGMVLGPLDGGIAAGIGSFAFDLLFPGYISSALFTFIFKFALSCVCGVTYRLVGKNRISQTMACFAGVLCYVILNTVKNFLMNVYLYKMSFVGSVFFTAKGSIVPVFNATMSIFICIYMFNAVNRFLKRNVIL